MRKGVKNTQNSITARWVRGSLFITLLVLVLAESIFLVYTHNSYYTNTRQAIISRISTVSGQLKVKDAASEEERALYVSLLLEQFNEKSKFEVMLLDSNGNILSTSSGFDVKNDTPPKDYVIAAQSENGMGDFVGRTENGEKTMAVTYILPKPAGNSAALRFVTSLSLIDKQIGVNAGISILIVLVIFAFTILSGVYFIRSIVRPLDEVEISAGKIARGDFKVRLQSKHNDEIGRLCETINHMADELAKTDQLKNEFISSVSHELRTPLTSIKGWVETLAKVNDVTDENYQKGMQIVMCETDRLYAMVEELLDFSRMQNKGLSLNMEKLDLIAEVSDVVIMFEARAKMENINLIYPENDDFIMVYGDNNRLRQVFVNVLDNAFKYSPINGEVKVNIKTDADNVYISISDQGQGIPPEELEKVRIKFYKGKGAVRGSGIGLAVVGEILQAHGGDFVIESTVGIGTTVTIRLPLNLNAGN